MLFFDQFSCRTRWSISPTLISPSPSQLPGAWMLSGDCRAAALKKLDRGALIHRRVHVLFPLHRSVLIACSAECAIRLDIYWM
jgi:hypothetical protein